jgi:ribosomal protein S14
MPVSGRYCAPGLPVGPPWPLFACRGPGSGIHGAADAALACPARRRCLPLPAGRAARSTARAQGEGPLGTLRGENAMLRNTIASAESAGRQRRRCQLHGRASGGVQPAAVRRCRTALPTLGGQPNAAVSLPFGRHY